MEQPFVSPLPTLQIFADSKAATASRSRRAFPVTGNQQTPAQRLKTQKNSESRVGMDMALTNSRTGEQEESCPGQDRLYINNVVSSWFIHSLSSRFVSENVYA